MPILMYRIAKVCLTVISAFGIGMAIVGGYRGWGIAGLIFVLLIMYPLILSLIRQRQ